MGEVLFFGHQRKVPKRKVAPGGLPAKAGSLRFSQSPALAQLAISLALDSLKQGASFSRALLRCSAAPRGEEHQNPIDTDYYHPVDVGRISAA